MSKYEYTDNKVALEDSLLIWKDMRIPPHMRLPPGFNSLVNSDVHNIKEKALYLGDIPKDRMNTIISEYSLCPLCLMYLIPPKVKFSNSTCNPKCPIVLHEGISCNSGSSTYGKFLKTANTSGMIKLLKELLEEEEKHDG